MQSSAGYGNIMALLQVCSDAELEKIWQAAAMLLEWRDCFLTPLPGTADRERTL